MRTIAYRAIARTKIASAHSAALKPAESLIPEERAFILRYFFQAHVGNMIRRYPRYGELYDMHHAGHTLNAQALRDLQVLSQIAWFDEDYLANDADVREMVRKGSGGTVAVAPPPPDQIVVIRGNTRTVETIPSRN